MPASSPPFYYTLLALALGLSCTVGKVAIGDTQADGPLFAKELLGVLAGASFAAAGVNQFARLWLGPYWVRRTAPIIKGLTQEAVTAISQMAIACVRIARDVEASAADAQGQPQASAAGHWPDDKEICLVFQLPQTDQIRRLIGFHEKRFEQLWFHPPADAGAGARLLESLDAHGPVISGELAACEAMLAGLARYRQSHDVALDLAAVGVRREAAEVLRYRGTEHPNVHLAIGSLMGLFGALHALCATLTEMYADVAKVTRQRSYLIEPRAAFTVDAPGEAQLPGAGAAETSGAA